MVKKVTINGRFYDQPAKETAKELGLKYSTLMSRIKSNSEKYKGWVASEMKVDILIDGKSYGDIDTAIFALLDLKNRIKKTKVKNRREDQERKNKKFLSDI